MLLHMLSKAWKSLILLTCSCIDLRLQICELLISSTFSFYLQVHARVDSIAVGKLSLNLTCFNKETLSVFGHRLNLALKNLLPFTHCIPLSVDYLNKVSLVPKKDYQTNRYMQFNMTNQSDFYVECHWSFAWLRDECFRLASGILQLAEGSHLTIDETQLQAGTLNSTGVENARVLRNLLELQKVIRMDWWACKYLLSCWSTPDSSICKSFISFM